MSLSDVIKTALDQISHIARTETVVGEPIQAGNVMLIPVSRVSIGFAAGGADVGGKNSSGAGPGGGVNIVPIAFIAVTHDKVQVHPISKLDAELARILSVAPGMIKKVSEFLGGKKAERDAEASEPAGPCA